MANEVTIAGVRADFNTTAQTKRLGSKDSREIVQQDFEAEHEPPNGGEGCDWCKYRTRNERISPVFGFATGCPTGRDWSVRTPRDDATRSDKRAGWPVKFFPAAQATRTAKNVPHVGPCPAKTPQQRVVEIAPRGSGGDKGRAGKRESHKRRGYDKVVKSGVERERRNGARRRF
jgi:hypothetical protein